MSKSSLCGAHTRMSRVVIVLACAYTVYTVCSDGRAFMLQYCCVFTLSAPHPAHILKLLAVHSCKSYWFSSSSFLGRSIPVQDNACEHAAENQGTSPLMSFFFRVSREKEKKRKKGTNWLLTLRGVAEHQICCFSMETLPLMVSLAC